MKDFTQEIYNLFEKFQKGAPFAFSKFADGDFSLLDLVIKENNKYRSEYKLDDREKEQNVVYIRNKI